MFKAPKFKKQPEEDDDIQSVEVINDDVITVEQAQELASESTPDKEVEEIQAPLIQDVWRPESPQGKPKSHTVVMKLTDDEYRYLHVSAKYNVASVSAPGTTGLRKLEAAWKEAHEQ